MPTERLDLLGDAVFVTGNPAKLEEARRICGATLAAVELELPEVQSLDVREILHHKAESAYQALERPLVVEETGLELAALSGFPGPLVKWMLSAVGAEGIARTATALGDTAAIARCTLLLFRRDQQVFGEGEIRGRVVLPARGSGGFGWDPVFQPEGEERTYAEMSAIQKARSSHRAAAWRNLLAALGRQLS